MKTVLHIGAHRTATTTFQRYMQDHADDLCAQKVVFWGPKRTRRGLFSGVLPGLRPGYSCKTSKRARGRLRLAMERVRVSGAQTLVISDENLIGSTRACLRTQALYPAIGERMARYAAAFDGSVDEVILTVRSLDTWWRSVVAYAVTRGAPAATGSDCAAIADRSRSWRAVVEDLACAMPDTTIRVLPFEHAMGQPQDLLGRMACVKLHGGSNMNQLNRAPDVALLRQILQARGENPTQIKEENGRWNPFTPDQAAILRQRYADDLAWLGTGADGLAVLTEDPRQNARQKRKSSGYIKDRGRPKHVTKVGTLAQSG